MTKYITSAKNIDYKALPDRVVLCGIAYTTHHDEDLIVFSPECSFYGTFTVLYFYWNDMWQFLFKDTWNRIPAAHVRAALEFLEETLGK